MSKILVTGGAGFIGSHTVVNLVEQGYEPIILDNFSNSDKKVLKAINELCGKDIKFYEGDCRKKEDLDQLFTAEKDIVGVIHFAAYKAVGESVENPLSYYHNNVVSLVYLLQSMEENNINNLVFSSSCTVYGEPEKLPVSEDFPRQQAASPYGNTKMICEDIVRDAASANGKLKAVLLRYFNPIGAHPSAKIGELPLGVPNNLVPFITQTAIGLRKELTVFGDDYNTKDGSAVRDYIHVVDLASAHVAALSYIQNQKISVDVFNVGTGQGNTVLEVVKGFEEVSGEALNYKIGPRRSGDVEAVYADTKKISEVLGWTPKLGLKEALADAWNWEKSLQQ